MKTKIFLSILVFGMGLSLIGISSSLIERSSKEILILANGTAALGFSLIIISLILFATSWVTQIVKGKMSDRLKYQKVAGFMLVGFISVCLDLLFIAILNVIDPYSIYYPIYEQMARAIYFIFNSILFYPIFFSLESLYIIYLIFRKNNNE